MNKFKDWQSSYQKIWVKHDHHLTAKHPQIPVSKSSAEREERVNCVAHIQPCPKEPYFNFHEGGRRYSRGLEKGNDEGE